MTATRALPILGGMAAMPGPGEAHIVLVEDDPSQRLLFSRWLELAGWRVTSFEDAEACLAHIDSLLPDVVCLDLHLPGMDGHEALTKLKAQYPSVPVLVITGDSDVETVVESMRRGGHDFLVKPVDRTRLETQVRNAVAHARLSLRVTHLEREAGGVTYPGIIGTSEPMRRLYRQIDRIATSPATVLIRGESGTGKELVARTIHENSASQKGPLVAINCAAIPETLQESELFGHEKGAFTGADSLKKGHFEEADGGTLFLDEVAELSASLQAKLLRVLQERTFRRLGGRRDLSSHFRLIAASHADLRQRVAEGRFREDLFYRLAVFELDVPPLRHRAQDIASLAAHFLADRGLMGERIRYDLTPESLELLAAYDWPGNVRELANALQRATVVASGGRIRPSDLPPRIREVGRDTLHRGQSAPTSVHDPGSNEFLEEPGAEDPVVEAAAGSAPQDFFETTQVESTRLETFSELGDFFDSGPSLELIEALAIERAMVRHRSNVSAVARELGVGRNTLYRKMERYEIRQRMEGSGGDEPGR
ncbi:MAG: sigma-54 dependent transcriptional regulator [Thermoanaerobaculia bacterium]|nr:sigma-54 dependent transcriptional regulator [Thermoanaerobaculia bacterium]